MPGKDGMEKMATILSNLRNTPPTSVNGLSVVKVTDFLSQTIKESSKGETPLVGLPKSNVLRYDLSDNKSYFIVRPSGTEPKIKLYLGTFADSSEEATAIIDGIVKDAEVQFDLV